MSVTTNFGSGGRCRDLVQIHTISFSSAIFGFLPSYWDGNVNCPCEHLRFLSLCPHKARHTLESCELCIMCHNEARHWEMVSSDNGDWWWDSDFWQLANFTSHSPDYFGQNYPQSFVIDASYTFQGIIKIEKPWLKGFFAKQQTNIQVCWPTYFIRIGNTIYWAMVLKPISSIGECRPVCAYSYTGMSAVCTMCNRIKWKLTTHSGAPGAALTTAWLTSDARLLVCSHFLFRPPEPQSRWCRGL